MQRRLSERSRRNRKKIKKVDNEAKLNYEDLIKITKEFKEKIKKRDNLKIGHEIRKKPPYNKKIAKISNASF